MTSVVGQANKEPNVIRCAFQQYSLHPASGRSPRVSPSQLQRWDQRVREGRAVAAGFGAARRDVGGEAGAHCHLFYNAAIFACQKVLCLEWLAGPSEAPCKPPGRSETAPGAPRCFSRRPQDGSEAL